MAILNDRAAQFDWEKFRESIRKSTPVDLTETPADKKKRIADLEAHPQKWKEYYFKKFTTSKSPAFHIKASARLLGNFEKNKQWYEVRNWARGLSKTTTAMMDFLYLAMTGKLKFILYISSTYDAAEAFLTKYQCQLDSNRRLINDYGKQELPGSWSSGDFTTRDGVRFMALGAGQSPRGQSNDEFRPDGIVFDDFDTDAECRNPDTIDQKWDWFEKAVMFAVDVANPYLVLWLGNIIAPDCCVVRAGERADYKEVINIRDEDGNSVWPEKNSEQVIDRLLGKVSWEAGQQEYFNNPVRQGQTFKEITWGKCPPLKELDFAVAYSDPATSNKDKPTLRSKAQNSVKGTALVGFKNEKYYLYTCVVDNMTNAHFIEGMYLMRSYVKDATALYNFIENNSLQDPFYTQVLLPLIYAYGKENGGVLGVTPDGEKKGEKWARVESELEPLFRFAKFVFNEDEKSNPHMQRMASQFLTASATSRDIGGPDMVQGAVHKIKEKNMVKTVGGIEMIKRKSNKKRW
ncbi:hypothetical protein [Arachidicoccus soli]|uniref:Terminase n=1 Tax=Arachidicoccus soli TaxID=2341117 RepID=A0A386HRD5_9BACT|nr:hypothetical protein [Arachidicoccus soli]AYD48209.1 hypothetical protein D6B99_11735 [Arachidicoccus soli]